MLFNSLAFAVFFPLATALYFLTRPRYRWFVLLVASGIFYMWLIPKYILILLLLIAIDYTAGILLERTSGRSRRLVLWLSLAANLGVLGTFKYFNFASSNLQHLAGALHLPYRGLTLAWALPIGLSFHTFQSMAYTIEVYRGRFPAERHLGRYALYVLFYPQLVAGPIERPMNLLPQLEASHRFEYRRVVSGLQLMATGLLMKVVVADRLADAVNPIYANPESASSLSLLVATYFFSIQIFCDFAGYTNIARGAARVMGIELMVNFRQPYFSQSVPEFWRRWHISLSTWFRDYVYIPLGGSRGTLARTCRNLLIVFLASGLWHGANWTFLAWGGLHGIYLASSRVFEAPRRKLAAAAGFDRHPRAARLFRVLVTFHLVTVAWVFFRAATLKQAFSILAHLLPTRVEDLRLDLPATQVVSGFFLIAALLSFQARERLRPLWDQLARQPAVLRWAFYYALLLAFLLFGRFSGEPFIYFQF